MTERNAKGKTPDLYGSGLPKGRRLKSAGKDDRGGLCTLPPNMRTTDDLVSIIRGELRNLLDIIGELAGQGTTRREKAAEALAFDAAQWCDAIAVALESGKWPEFSIERESDAARVWADAGAGLAAACDGGGGTFHEHMLAFSARKVQSAIAVNGEAA
jgi:hypothetical protein